MNPTNTFFIGNGGIVQIDDVLSSMAGNTRKNPGGDEPDDPKLKEEKYFASMEIPASTLRFSFGDLNYDPTQDTAVASRHDTADRAGGGTPAGYGGTWTKLRTKYTNIWDYTYVDNTLLNEFDNGNLAVEDPPATRFWNDVEHNPIKIIASNTAGCESFKRAFQGCWAITEIWKLDTSDATSTYVTFSYCKNLKKICKLDLSESSDMRYMFQQCWNITECEIILPTDKSKLSLEGMFMGCGSLEKIGGTFDLVSVTSMYATFTGCQKLEDITFDNSEGIKNLSFTFSACNKIPIQVIESLNTSICTNFSSMLCGNFNQPSSGFVIYSKMNNIDRIPNIDIAGATDVSYMFMECDIKEIDATKLSVLSGSVNVRNMFKGNRNCKSGILEAYTALDAVDSNHTECFQNCGIDTEEGRESLEQIPTSWGGLKEE